MGSEAILEYYNWMLKENNYKNIVFKKIEDDEEKGFAIFEINDASDIYYYLLARNNGIVYSIKFLGGKEMSMVDQLDYLRILQRLNRE